MNKSNAAMNIERLLNFTKQQNMIDKLDIIPCRNSLMDLFRINEPYEGEIPEESLDSAVPVLESLLDYAYEIGLLEENTTTHRDLLDAKIMGLLMPRQSEVAKNFYCTCKESNVIKATDNFYKMSIASNYIRMDRIKKNLYWEAPTGFGSLEITVNLSKPEKDPKEIAASKLVPQTNYPKCLLCIENVGYAGTINHPARQNHRVIPVTVGQEQWYLQYSPYVYYNEHCILFHGNHVPMKISDKTFTRMFDFVEQFPHYFIGSNADLSIVGGSILSHEHYQGGRHVFPMEKAPIEVELKSEEYSEIKAGIVRWPLSVIRLSSKNNKQLKELSVKILKAWREYSDEKQGILAFTKKDGESIPHNTITPIARKNANGDYEIDLVLRNNRTSEEHPDGIYHPHKELHHIKKENIGLIEVMGLAVLPARLNKELKLIEEILCGNHKLYEEAFSIDNHELNKHAKWIKELVSKYGTTNANEKAEEYIQKEVGNKFLQVLLDAGVYKKDEVGTKGFVGFMNSIGFK
jgi:UDPglucose--hexose-1-phosphate uridylyltransferase